MVQLVAELMVLLTLIWQLPEGFGPYEMPPFSEKVMGNDGADAVKLTWLATVTLGSPLITRLETEQFVGVTVIAVWRDPPPLEFKVPSISPATEIVPPAEQATVSEMGKLQFSPVAVTVQGDD